MSPSPSKSKLTAFLNVGGLAHLRIGSSRADFSSLWNPVDIFLNSE
jgi:hypothetical protein